MKNCYKIHHIQPSKWKNPAPNSLFNTEVEVTEWMIQYETDDTYEDGK